MKAWLGFVLGLALCAPACAAKPPLVDAVEALVPAGYVVTEKIQGDLNQDGQADAVLLVKATDKSKFVPVAGQGVLDRNRRGLVIAFQRQGQYQLALLNVDCFSSENEDGGVYFAPDLSMDIVKGRLLLHYAHGRYGYWHYTFQYRDADFVLIGYDASSNRGPTVLETLSVNLLTRKSLKRVNVNQDKEDAEEKFQEQWRRLSLRQPIRLKDVKDFDGLDYDPDLGLRR